MTEKMRDGIIRRGAGYSYVIRERDPESGKTKPRWVSGFATRKAAKEARDAARHSVNSGTYVAPQDLTVAAWLDQWIAAHEVELKPSTAASYRDKIDLYLKPTIGQERLQSLSPSRLSVVWRDLQVGGGKNGKPLSRRSVEYARAVLRKALEDAVVERVLQVNPVQGSKMAKRDGKPQHTTWTGGQVRAFLDHVGDDRWAAMWALFLGTGARRGEIAGLRWADAHGPVVDLELGLVRIEVSTTQIRNERVTTTPKNHERRTIAIDPETVAALKAWKATQAAERLALGKAYADVEGLVFTWPDGRPVMPDYMTKAFPKAQAAVNAKLAAEHAAAELDGPAPKLPHIVLHEARHSHATILLRSGVPVHIVAKRLGHKDPSVTLNVYADAIPDDDTSAVDVYSKAVWGA
jgi:integrase